MNAEYKKTNIAINGFGRIGRLTARALLTKYADQVTIVAINDLTSVENLAYLTKYDTSYKQPEFSVSSADDTLILGNQEIPVFAIRDPQQLPWKELGVDIVLECTGIFNDKEGVSKHLVAGARSVIISSPSKSNDIPSIVLGVNEVIKNLPLYSNASCTTNCIAPVLKCLSDSFGIVRGNGLTVHAYTATQTLQDSPTTGTDYRKSRAAAINLIPSTTGAGKAIAQVMPELEGKITLNALRVPVITGSYVQLTCELTSDTTKENIMMALNQYATTHPQIMQLCSDQLVSSDIIGNSHSVIVDESLLNLTNGLVTITLWYDNEWGYSNRLADLALQILE
jgi:glyceraldehyde 3-phosphate dehydrogenase